MKNLFMPYRSIGGYETAKTLPISRARVAFVERNRDVFEKIAGVEKKRQGKSSAATQCG